MPMINENGLFDRSRIEVLPLCEREHDLSFSNIMPLKYCELKQKNLEVIANKIVDAKKRGSAVILMMGAHLLRAGVQRYMIDLMEKGYISCIAMNGAGVIHDFEYALIGATTESVERYISKGQFGLWKETGQINDIVSLAAKKGLGLGEAVGREILNGDFPHKDISVLAAGQRFGVPITVHVGIGYDITYEHSNCNGAAYGETSYRDFLRFTRIMQDVEGGVVMNFGSSVMAPEVYLKALSMVRNVAHQEGRSITKFTTLVCDLAELPEDHRKEAPSSQAAYYFRPWKTMLVRTVADGGESYYVKGDHAETFPQLWTALRKMEK